MQKPTNLEGFDPNKVYIGLFGTCGTTTWRQEFIDAYKDFAIDYFNPQVADWNPELAVLEAQHLVHDDIIVFPVTAETYGTGSLAETGFSILQVLESVNNGPSHRKVIIYIEPHLDPTLAQDNPVAAKESVRARALVSAHLAQINNPNVYVVKSMPEMLMTSIRLYPAVAAMRQAQAMMDNVRSEYTAGMGTSGPTHP